MSNHRQPSRLTLLAGLLAATTLVTACAAASGPLGSVPVPSASAESSVAQGSPDATPAPSAEASDEPSAEPTSSSGAGSPSPSTGTSAGTTVVRAYFWLDGPEGSRGLVAVLREVPATKAVATAAVNALLGGPTGIERDRGISSQVPDGTQLLGITINNDSATIDLSSEFQSGAGGDAYQKRIAQVVYTLTQFPSIKAIGLQIEGEGDSMALDRNAFVDFLPAIWVDRPAWGAAIGNPAHVTGSANVFEATFRVSILDGAGKVIADQQVMASCGTGCRGTFDTNVPYTIGKAQYGTLRAYDPSEVDGSPESIRDYRVWLTPRS